MDNSQDHIEREEKIMQEFLKDIWDIPWNRHVIDMIHELSRKNIYNANSIGSYPLLGFVDVAGFWQLELNEPMAEYNYVFEQLTRFYNRSDITNVLSGLFGPRFMPAATELAQQVTEMAKKIFPDASYQYSKLCKSAAFPFLAVIALLHTDTADEFGFHHYLLYQGDCKMMDLIRIARMDLDELRRMIFRKSEFKSPASTLRLGCMSD